MLWEATEDPKKRFRWLTKFYYETAKAQGKKTRTEVLQVEIVKKKYR